MMNEHEHFEELCAVVGAGLASPEEFRELKNHLQNCEECRDRFGDFAQIGAGILSADGPECRPPAGMSSRFVSRAIAEGIPLRKPAHSLPTWTLGPPLVWAGTIAAGVLIL